MSDVMTEALQALSRAQRRVEHLDAAIASINAREKPYRGKLTDGVLTFSIDGILPEQVLVLARQNRANAQATITRISPIILVAEAALRGTQS